MGKSILNYLGAILALIGGLAMILCTAVPALSDLCDQNWYTTGIGGGLIVIGLFAHIFINKYVSEESKGYQE